MSASRPRPAPPSRLGGITQEKDRLRNRLKKTPIAVLRTLVDGVLVAAGYRRQPRLT
jgi:hypothetical protein